MDVEGDVEETIKAKIYRRENNPAYKEYKENNKEKLIIEIIDRIKIDLREMVLQILKEDLKNTIREVVRDVIGHGLIEKSNQELTEKKDFGNENQVYYEFDNVSDSNTSDRTLVKEEISNNIHVNTESDSMEC